MVRLLGRKLTPCTSYTKVFLFVLGQEQINLLYYYQSGVILKLKDTENKQLIHTASFNCSVMKIGKKNILSINLLSLCFFVFYSKSRTKFRLRKSIIQSCDKFQQLARTIRSPALIQMQIQRSFLFLLEVMYLLIVLDLLRSQIQVSSSM